MWISDQEVSRRAPWLQAYSRRRLFLPVRSYERCKRLLDVTVALVLLPFVLPLIAVCALAIWLESPRRWMFCWQTRMGRGGVPFRALALRTAVGLFSVSSGAARASADRARADLGTRGAGRVTRVGRLVRGLGLADLPLFYNVLRGDMSVVGPQPEAPRAEDDQPWHRCRLAVKPGFTGVSQISLRAEAPADRRLLLDLAYVHYRCLALDLAIVLRCLPAVLLRRRAAS
jgi:lipopolysaccharide/colanic/teichoic acid biosynthesis glycosyltransferase